MTSGAEVPRGSPAASDRASGAILAVLAVAAGCVDAVSFLGLGQVLTAAMTGNTVLLASALGQAELPQASRAGVALLGFFGGILIGASIAERGAGGTWSRATSVALGLELMLLIGLAITWHLFEQTPWIESRFPLIAAAGLAMGIQSAVAHQIGVAGIATTYVTGTLTTLGTGLVGWLRRRVARPRSEPPPSWLPAWVWLAYGLGAAYAGATRLWWPSVPVPPAVTGAVGELRWPSPALLAPIVIVATVMLITTLRPRPGAAGNR